MRCLTCNVDMEKKDEYHNVDFIVYICPVCKTEKIYIEEEEQYY